MPDGRKHYKNWKRFILPVVLLSVLTLLVMPPAFVILLPIGYLLGRYIDPDLDQVGVVNAEGRMMNELKIFGAFLAAWFLPYAYTMRFVGIGRKGHRNFFSHTPVVGTVIRWAWLLLFPPISVTVWLMWRYGYESLLVNSYVLYGMAGAVVGLSLSDAVHFIADLTERRR